MDIYYLLFFRNRFCEFYDHMDSIEPKHQAHLQDKYNSFHQFVECKENNHYNIENLHYSI